MPCWRAALIYGHYAVGINKAAVLLVTQLVPKINVLLSITSVLSPSSATMAKLRACNWIALGERRHIQGSACLGMQLPKDSPYTWMHLPASKQNPQKLEVLLEQPSSAGPAPRNADIFSTAA